jgi:hypothetical protein
MGSQRLNHAMVLLPIRQRYLDWATLLKRVYKVACHLNLGRITGARPSECGGDVAYSGCTTR